MSATDYQKALRLGQKAFRQACRKGLYPYLPALDELVSRSDIVSEVSLGLIQIPIEQIVGTKTAGRRSAFANNFMPLLAAGSEFAEKWSALCSSHLEEGINTPIIAYEFLNRFYVLEGNKRVSVLKFFEADSIPGTVVRLLPQRNESPENKLYYEFLDFYNLSKINYLEFSASGCYETLQKRMGRDPLALWSDDERMDFKSLYYRFARVFLSLGGKELSITPGDALLAFLDLYDYGKACQMTERQLQPLLAKIWEDILLLQEKEAVSVLMTPAQEPKPSLLTKIIPSSPQRLKVAFVHEKDAARSSWTYSHELGRMHLEQVYGHLATTKALENIPPGPKADRVLESLINEGYDTIFTTSSKLAKASLRAAVNHKNVRVLNCSQNLTYRYIRMYYGRMYEAKFLMGAIAGAMSSTGRLGYLADFPIYGTTASINAFALGARMINPRAQVFLEWSSVKDWEEIEGSMRENQVEYLSDRDMTSPQAPSREFGLHSMDPQQPVRLAMPLWHWGKFYEKIVHDIINGSWRSYDESEGKTKPALNYWWGMSADVIDVIYSQNLPPETKRLVELLRSSICSGNFHPFCGPLRAQDGLIKAEDGHTLTPAEIITMDWLADNVIGSIPSLEELSPDGREMADLQGL